MSNTRTITIHEFGSDETCWVSHDFFLDIIEYLRKFHYEKGPIYPDYEKCIFRSKNIDFDWHSVLLHFFSEYNKDVVNLLFLEKEKKVKFFKLIADSL